MDVTLLYFEDCPNWLVANAHLETLAGEIAGMHIARYIVDTPEEAERTGFRGSPSILVDGIDLFAETSDPVGLSCRVYQTPAGAVGSPTLDQLRAALTASDAPIGTEEHWDAVYERRPTSQLGWYEPEPSTLNLVAAHSSPDDSLIDVGGGDSRLVDALLSRGYHDVTVLDLSGAALERAKARLGRRSDAVHWAHADITNFTPDRAWNVWHDRAVFHFLATDAQRAGYNASALNAIAPGGTLIVATFNMDGPKECAGLPVQRYDVDSLPAAFAPEFEVISVGNLAAGPSNEGDQRPYVGAVLRRAEASPLS